MESHGHKSLRAQRSRAQLGPHSMPMTPDRGEPESGPSAMNGNGCGKHVITPVFGPPPPFKEYWHRMKGWYKATDKREPFAHQTDH